MRIQAWWTIRWYKLAWDITDSNIYHKAWQIDKN